jgi:hypothetical protein
MSLLSDKMTELENIFQPLDVFPSLRYSTVTKQWYVAVISYYGVFVYSRGGGSSGIVQHRDLPEDAVNAYVDELKKAKYFYIAKQSLHNGKWYPLQYKKWDGFKGTFVELNMPVGETPYNEFIEEEFLTIEQMVDWIANNRDKSWAKTHKAMSSIDGTSIQRVRIPHELANQHLDIASNNKQQSFNVWCIGVGTINNEKEYFYGWTMADALKKAIKDIKAKNNQVP